VGISGLPVALTTGTMGCTATPKYLTSLQTTQLIPSPLAGTEETG
jgi:hypothetical protein